MALSPRLRSFQQDIITKNRDLLHPRRGESSTAPMPDDPARCRWCHGRKRALFDGGPLEICDAGCTANDQAPYRRDCASCDRAFDTGNARAVVCHACEQADPILNGSAGRMLDGPRLNEPEYVTEGGYRHRRR